MNIENNRLAIGFISLIIIASGCSHAVNGTTGEASAESVVIENFSVTPQNSLSGQPTNVQLEIRNNGDQDAENIAAELTNIPIGESEDQWDFSSRWSSLDTLRSADPDADIPARSERMTWSTDSPNVDQGLELDYNFRVNVFYEYGSTATSTLTLMDRDQFREEGRMGRPTMQNTDGPIQMEIRTRQPMIFNEDERVCILVRNEGPGTPFYSEENTGEFTAGDVDGVGYDEVTEEEFDTVKISVESHPGLEEFSVQDNHDEEVELVRGQGEICYEVSPLDDDQDRLEVPIQFDAEYGYVIDDQTTATVTGSDRFN